MGFRDVSGACASPGGLLFQAVARSRVEDTSFQLFCNGYAIKYDALINGTNQVNYIQNVTAINVQNGLIFANGTNFDNWVEFGSFYHSQTGGGICVDFQGNEGNTSGGTNFVMSGSCNFFPIAIHLVDQHADYISAKAENTSVITGNTSVVGGRSNGGSVQSGVGIQIDATSSSNCFQNRLISPSLAWFDTFISVSSNCMQNLIVAPDYSSAATNFTTLTDLSTTDLVIDQNQVSLGSTMHLNQGSAGTLGLGGIAGTGTTSSSLLTVSFNASYNMVPVCVVTVVSGGTSTYAAWISSISVSGMVIKANSPSVQVNWSCVGNPN
jgi:hypothetical protein